MYLDAVGPDIVGTAGSDPARALSVAAWAFDTRDAPSSWAGAGGRPRAVLLVSDGENPNAGESGDGAAGVADELRDAGITVLALAVGTEQGGTIPLPNGRVQRDRAGEVIRTRLDVDALTKIAGADVMLAADDPLPMLNQRLDELAGRGGSIERVPAAAERYQWPLGWALLLLVADRLLAAWTGRLSPAVRLRRGSPRPAQAHEAVPA
jgi:hypothetical protein